VQSVSEWFDAGDRIELKMDQWPRPYSIFCRAAGSGGWLTLLHGFPTCSLDWERIQGPLAERHRLLMFDFLGFGDSDKPANHTYSIHEQADIVEALWTKFGVTETGLLVHDYGVSVGQELLARRIEERLRVRINKTAWMNGGLYAHLHRPLLAQKLLRKPIIGAILSRMIGEKTFASSLGKVFSPAHPLGAQEASRHWQAIKRRNGKLIYHRLIHYIADRRRHHERWERALEQVDSPKLFLWGMADPVSGHHMAEHLRRRIADVNLVALEDVGHYPHLEAPELIVDRLLNFFDEQI
jgi:pimeloyl-ACP methyl ester carboxylesterase